MLTDSLFFWSLLVLIAVVLSVLGLVLYVATRQGGPKEGNDPRIVRMRFDSLRASFRQAVELIETNIAERSQRYSIPWVLVINDGAVVRSLPISQSGVASALSAESASAAAAQGIGWQFFDKGIVVEMQGAYLGSPDDENAAEKPWDEFLSLCRAYRPQRPFDSVVITVPASMLMNSSPDAMLDLTKLARIAHRRLWLAQNRFAMRFAVYVAISGAEEIEGFAAFARALPDPMRAGMLGWSSPYDLSTLYQSAWVDQAVDGMVRTLTDAAAELFATRVDIDDARRFFLLPGRVAALRTQLAVYLDELMHPSAYHEPFFFRGIYLTGDSSEAAKAAVADLGAPDGNEAGQPVESSVLIQHMQEPAFLRDLFEKKIFQEYGLARPSRQQLTRPVLHRAVRWGGVTLLTAWIVTLGYATYQLAGTNPEVARMLRQIDADNRYRLQALERGDNVPAEWYRTRTLALLAAIEKLSEKNIFTIVMPGSWAVWDDLDARVVARVEREFGEIAVTTLRRELYVRAAKITGVAQDESTAELIIGGECAAPAVEGSAIRKAVLAAEETPEFAGLMQYIDSVERLDQAINAMEKLLQTNETGNADLRLLVRYTLGAELPDKMSQSVRLLRDTGVSGSAARPGRAHIRQAVQCALLKGIDALHARMLRNNDLLVLERQFSVLHQRMLSLDARTAGFFQTAAALKDMLALIGGQELLLSSNKGRWMKASTADFGPAYDALLARIEGVPRLLGQEATEQAREHASQGFNTFRAEFDTFFNAEGNPGVVWQDKEERFGLSSDRVALRDAINYLLAQPFMVAPAGQDLPTVPHPGVLTWDIAKLDQALSLAEQRKKFLLEGMPKFPVNARSSVAAFVNFQIANLTMDRVVEALSTSSSLDIAASSDNSAFDAARQRLAGLQLVFLELGAASRADALQQLVAADAAMRLNQLDSGLNQMDLYAVRGRDFGYWNGERGPLIQAFGVVDSSGLQQHLGLQFSRIEALGKQAEIYLSALDKSARNVAVVKRWTAINREIERYRLKNPNGSLVIYEQFLLTASADIDQSNCVDRLTGRAPAARPTDFFGERHLYTYNALFKRCVELRAQEQQEAWSTFATSFNKQLAGRHPFAASGTRDAIDADLDDVGLLVRSGERLSKVVKDASSSAVRSQISMATRRFIEQFDKVRIFLAPLYPAEEGTVAGFDLNVEFRVNQASEVEGNKVIDWSLEVGPQILRLRDAPRPLRWEPGMPITLTLRLAKDVSGFALPDVQQSALLADDKTIAYRFTDAWALIRLLQRYREPDAAAARSDTKVQLLRMEFPIGAIADSTRADSRGRVFWRLTISPVGKRTPLAWPGLFPSRAPDTPSP